MRFEPLTFTFRYLLENHIECCWKNLRQHLQVSAARVKIIFSLAVHFGGYCLWRGISTIHKMSPFPQLCGRGHLCDRQWKHFTKPLNLTLEALFYTSKQYLLSEVKRLGISETVVPPPESPPKIAPLTV